MLAFDKLKLAVLEPIPMVPNLNNPNEVSEAGKRIYDSRYREEFEEKYWGQFVAINVIDGSATLGQSPSSTLFEAKENQADGFFHLMRVGHATAYELKTPQHYGRTNRTPGR